MLLDDKFSLAKVKIMDDWRSRSHLVFGGSGEVFEDLEESLELFLVVSWLKLGTKNRKNTIFFDSGEDFSHV